MSRGEKINAKRALEVIQQAADEVSSDSFCGFSEEEEVLPAKRLRTIASYNNKQTYDYSGRSSVISQYSEMSCASAPKVERKPTRRPDPHVNNRNAIMARENRRKHKEHQERLERENAILQKENDELRALMKSKDRQISSLRHEYKYLKSVIANKTQIVDILRSVQHSRVPITTSLDIFRSDPSNTAREMSPASVSTVSAATSSGYQSPSNSENSDYEMDVNALPTDPKWASDPIFSDIPDDVGTAASHDVDVNHFLDFVDNPDAATPAAATPIVRDEHSYSENIEDPGVCVHISNQRVSIEFCSKCHNRSSGFLDDI